MGVWRLLKGVFGKLLKQVVVKCHEITNSHNLPEI